MTPRYALSDRATRSFRDIAEYSYRKYGPATGRKYAKDMLTACDRIARGIAQHWSCRDRLAHDLREDLRFARCGRHYIIFVQTPQGILIADFLHQSSDIAARLEKLP